MIQPTLTLTDLAEPVRSIPPPSTFGIPHSHWRNHQYDSAVWAQSLGDLGICQAPTGSGKSALAAYLSAHQRTVVLTRTKMLQRQYGHIYGAFILMGRGNYACVHPDAQDRRCDACLYAEQGMSKCPVAEGCEYLTAKHEAMEHPFPCVNYAYWLASSAFRSKVPGMLVFDEVHLASDVTLDYVGTAISDRKRADWRLPVFPPIKIANPAGVGKALAWLSDSREIVRKRWSILSKQVKGSSDERLIKDMRAAEYFGYDLAATMGAIMYCPEAWFIKSGPGVGVDHGRKVPGFVARPLTARYHFPKLFLGEHRALLMSATIGDFKTFATELGIPALETRRVPSNFPPATRPVYVLNCPKLNYKSSERDYEHQADAIAEAINACPPEWSGIIHVTRKTEAPLLAERLAHRGVGADRLWVPPQKLGKRWIGTREQVELWDYHRKQNPNAIAIAWQFGEGYDGQEERICIVAKTPFPSTPPGSYEEARRRYSAGFYSQRTAWALQQMLGRTRRGEPEQYDTEEEIRGLVAVADGNYTRVQSKLDDDFREALVEL